MSDSSGTPSANPTRELAAIIFSDIAGYTAIMGRDERKALRALDDHRDLLRTILPRFNGRLVGEIGDGTLSSFHSALDAVNCARAAQAALQDDPSLRLLGLAVDPVEVFEDHHQRPVETLAQDDAFDRLQCAPLLYLPIHLRQRIVPLDDAEQTEQLGQRIFQTSIERYYSSGYFLAAGSFIILACNPEIVAQQIDHRQISACLAMRD